MGSLLSGWDSEFLDPDRVRLARNKSLTREEIAAFWRSHRQNHDDDDYNNNNGGDEQQQQQQQQQQQPLSPTATFIRSWRNSMDDIEEEGQSRRYSPRGRGLEKSKTYAGPESSVGLEKSKKGDDWWSRSNWAFLNEPPRDELDESAHKYAAQFHVAELATNKHHERTGSN